MGAVCIERAESLLKQNIDWEYLISISKLHKVAPLVFVNLIQIFPAAVPPHILPQLRSLIMAVVKQNLYLVRELASLIDIFEKNGISVIPYKGVVLASKVYQDPSLRQFVDIDLLVDRQQYIEAQELLIDNGYEPPPQREVEWERSFCHEGKKVGVDLHQALTPDYFPVYIDFSGLFARQELTEIGGVAIKSFSSEDLLIVLCIQLAKDAQWTAEVLIKVCDIAELLETSTDMDWDRVWQLCKELGTKRILLFALLVVNQIFDLKLPDTIWQKAQADPIARKAAKIVSENFFVRSEESIRNRIFTERVYLRKLARERWQDKVKHFLGKIDNRYQKAIALSEPE